MKLSKGLRTTVLTMAMLGLAGCVDEVDLSDTNQDVVSTNLTAYASGNSIVVTYDGMQGASSDFIVVAHPSDPANRYELLKLTGGGTSGSMTFDSTQLGAGTYQARAYYNWYGTHSFVVQQTSPSFTVTGGPALAATQSTYAAGASVPINYTGFTGATTDWVAINKAGTADDNYSAYQYTTAGGASGQLTFSGLAIGTYEARYHHQYATATYAVSPQFSIGTAVSPDQPIYSLGQPVTVAFDGIPSTATAYVAISVAGSPTQGLVQYQRTNGVVKGTKVFNGLPGATYEARAYSSSYVIISRSAQFVVTATTARVSTDQPSYQVGQPVTATFSGMRGVAGEYIAISLVGSPNASIVQYKLTNSMASGTQVFTGLPAGNYEARAYFQSYVIAARSTRFTVN